jgi:hypothetical protein
MMSENIIEEFDFEDDQAKEQFKKMESDIAIKLLESAIKKSDSLKAFLRDRWKVAQELAKNLMDKEIIKISSIDANLLDAYRNALAIGVDSSRQLPYRVLSTYYCPITSAIVYFDGINSQMIADKDAPYEFFEKTNLTPEEAVREVQEAMYRCEVSALLKVSSSALVKNIGKDKKVLLMIDGPIIDPPNKKLYDGYIKERANALLACKESGALVIGCVKTLEGYHFLNFLKNRKDLQELAVIAEGFGQDPQLIPFIFSTLYSRAPLLETIPIERMEPKWLVEEYGKSGIKHIYRIYLTLSGGRGTLLAVEYFVDKEGEAVNLGTKVCHAVRACALPGMKVPLPIMAAHRRCNIKRGSAEFLYKQLLTRALSCEEGASIVGAFSEGA